MRFAEYCQRGVIRYVDVTPGTYVVMNAFGKEGWEVFSVVQEEPTANNSIVRTFFARRPLGQPGKSCTQINEELSNPKKVKKPGAP